MQATDAALVAAGASAGLAVEIFGQGPTVVCLHSSGLSGRQWRGLAEALATTHRVVVPDLLGYGQARTPQDLASFATEDELVSFRPLLAALDEPVSFVGHSYGGYLALRLAAERKVAHPTGVAAVAAYEPVVFGVLDACAELGLARDPARADLQEMVDDDDGGANRDFFNLEVGGYEAWLSRFVAWWSGPGSWEGMRPPVQAAFRASQEKVHAEVRALNHSQPDLSAYVGLTAPCLFMHGTETREAAKAVCRRLTEALLNARTEVISGAGHMGPLTHRDAVNEAIILHLRS